MLLFNKAYAVTVLLYGEMYAILHTPLFSIYTTIKLNSDTLKNYLISHISFPKIFQMQINEISMKFIHINFILPRSISAFDGHGLYQQIRAFCS